MADPRPTPHHALTYPIPGPLPRPIPRPTLPPHPITLSVSTSTAASQLDPNEQTARPGNAHQHRLFLHGLSAATAADADEPDPGATPVDARMPAAPLSRPLTNQEEERLAHLDRLKFFFATAPSQWPGGRSPGEPGGVGSSSGWGMTGDGHTHGMHPSLNRFLLPTQEFVTCVFWNGLYHITGTDIVRALVFRFEAFGRPVHNMKKFEEGVFSDLRNLKPGVDASLEEPKSPFLDLLFKYQCIRTQKKQKVFYWFSVPHDRLFLDALDRDLKREKMGHPPTTRVLSEPALSFKYDPKRSLYDQFAKQSTPNDSESDQDADLSESDSESLVGATGIHNLHIDPEDSEMSDSEHLQQVSHKSHRSSSSRSRNNNNNDNNNTASFFSSIFGIFEGSPSYKQRRKKGHAHSSLSRSVSRSSSASVDDLADRGRPRSIVSVGSGHHHHHQPNASLSRERSQPYPSPYLHRQHSLPHFPPQDTAPQYDEFPPDAAALFQQQANRITRKSLPDVNVMMAQAFTAQQQPSSQPSAPFSTDDPTFGFDIFPVVPPHSSPSLQYDIDDKNRAHTCPLVSCNKLFKRMEHLKRHLRTHTLERPYMCPTCRKHFSRRDNLNQHIKTHERNDAATPVAVRALKGGVAQEMGDLDDPIGKIGMGPEMNTLGALNPAAMGMWREGSEDSDLSGAESEGFGDDRIGFFFDSQQQRQQHPMGASMSNTATTAADSMFAGIGISNVGEAPGMSGLSDMQMCQMEIQPDEIQRGIEERMLQPHAHALQYATVGPNFAQDSTLWAQPSPAFPSPSGSGQQQHGRHVNRASMTGSPVGLIARHTHSGSSSVSSLSAFVNGTGSGDEYGTSTSVPLFERSGMYSHGVVDSGNASSMGVAALAGSTRRPRSMTPSLVGGGGESGIGRPMSTVSSSHGSGMNGNGSRSESGSESCSPVPMISSMNVAGGQRVYHHQQHRPYANSGSGGGSTHSSPAVYSVSLGNVQAGGDSVQQHRQQVQQSQQLQEDEMQGGLRRSESRTSFSSEQKMFGISQHHMTTAYHHHHHHHQHHQQHHQSQQPLTESPVPYTIELPQPPQQQPHWNSHHGDVMSMVGIYDPSQQQ